MDVDPPLQAYNCKERSLEKMWELEKCGVIWVVSRSGEGSEVHREETRPSQSTIQTRNFWNDISSLAAKQQGIGNVHKHRDVAMTQGCGHDPTTQQGTIMGEKHVSLHTMAFPK